MDRVSRFGGKTVVLTGAARGIGLATARQALEEGAQVALLDLTQEALDNARNELGAAAERSVGLPCDVARQDHIDAAVARIMQEFGRIDILVNNAAINSYELPEMLSRDVFQRQIEIILGGSFFMAQAVANAWMIPNRSGVIINLGSGGAHGALPRNASYVAAKHGIVGLTKSLAVDWGQFGIRVNCVSPGFTYSDLSKAMAEKNPEMFRQRIARIPIGRGAQVEDISEAILFLASDAASSISGETLSVDGGMIALHPGFSPPKDNT